MAIDESILGTMVSIPHDFIEHSNFFIVLLTMLIELMNHFQRSVLFLHLLINHRKIEYILSRIVYHILSKWSLLPEFIIISHYARYFMLFSVSNIYVIFQEISKRNVIILEILKFLCFIERLLYHSMSDLGIKNEVTHHVVLIYQC